MNLIDLETPLETEKYSAPKTDNRHPFFISEYGKTYPHTPCYQLRMDSHTACIQYVISGSGFIMCNNQIYTVEEGDTFLLPERSNHTYYSSTDNHFERIWINFEGELASALIQIYGINEKCVFKNVDTQYLIEQIHIACKTNPEPEAYKNETSQLFLKLVQFLAKNKKDVSPKQSPIEKLRLYIDCHITENLKLSHVADKFGYSSEHIIRVFKNNYGITPHQYIVQSKIRLAMILLRTQKSSIEEISYKLSFSDPHHFSLQFQKHVGCRPSVYRKNFKEN